MGQWFLDPKSIALIAGGFSQLVITIWSTRHTAVLVGSLVESRLDMTGRLAVLETRVEQQEGEINRLRDIRATQP